MKKLFSLKITNEWCELLPPYSELTLDGVSIDAANKLLDKPFTIRSNKDKFGSSNNIFHKFISGLIEFLSKHHFNVSEVALSKESVFFYWLGKNRKTPSQQRSLRYITKV